VKSKPRRHQKDPTTKNEDKRRLTQGEASAWDVVVLSFKLLFKRIHFWIRPNLAFVILSIPIITGPGAKAALFHSISEGLKDPAGSRISIRSELKKGFHNYFWRSFLLSLIKFASLAVILAAIYFWVTRPEIGLRYISILAFYGLVMWWLASGYIYPILITHPEYKLLAVLGAAIRLAFQKPFESLLFAVVSTLLFILGLALLGPILLVIPALRAILLIQGYWYLAEFEIPGFLPEDVYARKHYNI
jgi:uncharacterized membrane protein YesL